MRKSSFPAGLLFLLFAGLSLGAQDSEATRSPGPTEPFEKEREALAAEVAAAVPDLPQSIREGVRQIPRHLFAPETFLSLTYQNRSLPLGGGKLLPAPGDLARIAALLNLTREDRVLVLGSGAGYGAELLAFLGKEVVLMEEAKTERDRVSRLLADPSRVGTGRNLTLMPDWSLESLSVLEPFDAIFLHGGVTEIPRSIMALAKPAARIAALLKGEWGSSLLVLIERTENGEAITVHGDMFFPVISDWNSENR